MNTINIHNRAAINLRMLEQIEASTPTAIEEWVEPLRLRSIHQQLEAAVSVAQKKYDRYFGKTGKYMPHQNTREKARRLAQGL